MNVLENLNCVEQENFSRLFLEKIQDVYSYDAKEIQDFLLQLNHDNLKDSLRELRSQLLDRAVEDLPCLKEGVLYNRRNMDKWAEDIYIIGNCVVNRLVDDRIYRILKMPASNSGTDVSQPGQIESDNNEGGSSLADIMLFNIELKKSMNELLKLVQDTRQELHIIKAKMDELYYQAKEKVTLTSGATATSGAATLSPPDRLVPPPIPETPLTPSAPPLPGLQAEGGQEPRAELQTNGVLPPRHETATKMPERNTPINPAQKSLNSVPKQRANQENGLGNFQLPKQQRDQVIRGNKFASESKRDEILGSSTASPHITGADMPGDHEPRSIYIGRLSSSVTVDKLRRHLEFYDIKNIIDIIQLNCRNPGQSSFCVVAEDEATEAALFDPLKWPKDTRVRLYTPQRKPSNTQPAGRSQRKNQHSNRYHRPAPVPVHGRKQRLPARQQGTSSVGPLSEPTVQPATPPTDMSLMQNLSPPAAIRPYYLPYMQTVLPPPIQPLQHTLNNGGSTIHTGNRFLPLRDANLWVPAC